MRKWTYLVAALLIGGSAATFTGCIDNEEPAGITELRGAKAEFIRAKTAYENVLTEIKKIDIEKAQVDLDLKKVTLQIEQLKVAKAQAQNEYDIAAIQNNLEQLAETQKAKLLELQKTTVTNQEALEKALIDLDYTLKTYKDGKYEKAISDAIGALSGLRSAVTSQESTVTGLQAQLLNAKAELGASYRLGLVSDSLKLEKALDIQNTVLAQLQGLADMSKTDLANEVVELDKQIGEIDNQVLEISKEINVLEAAIDPIEDKIKEIKIGYYNPTKVVTIPKVAAAIQKDFINYLKSYSINGMSSTWADFAAAPFYTDDEMTADYVSGKMSLKYNTYYSLDDAVSSLAATIKSNYEIKFKNAYYSTFYSYISGDITPEHVQQAATKIAELEQDKDVAKGIYDVDLKAWQDALAAYTTAANNYGYEYTPYDATWKVVTDYQALADDKKTDAEVKKVKDALIAYYAKRVPLDNPSLATVTVGTESLPLNKALANATYTNADFKTYLESNPVSFDVLGNVIDLTNKTTVINLPANEEDYGALHTYIAANQKVWNSNIRTLAAARVTAYTEDEYNKLIENRNTLDGTWFKYMNMMTAYEIFTTIDTWMKLHEDLIAISEGFGDEIKAIELLVEEQNVLKADQENAKYLKEMDRYALDNTQNVSYSSNPYYTYMNGKKQALEELRTSIGNYMNGAASSYNVYIYQVTVNTSAGKLTNGYWTMISGTAEGLTTQVSDQIIAITKALDMAKANIENFDKGWAFGSNGNIANLEKQLADAEAALADAKTQLKRGEDKLQALLDAYAGTTTAE